MKNHNLSDIFAEIRKNINYNYVDSLNYKPLLSYGLIIVMQLQSSKVVNKPKKDFFSTHPVPWQTSQLDDGNTIDLGVLLSSVHDDKAIDTKNESKTIFFIIIILYIFLAVLKKNNNYKRKRRLLCHAL